MRSVANDKVDLQAFVLAAAEVEHHVIAAQTHAVLTQRPGHMAWSSDGWGREVMVLVMVVVMTVVVAVVVIVVMVGMMRMMVVVLVMTIVAMVAVT